MNKNLKAVRKLALALVAGCLTLSAIASNNPENGEADLSISPGKNATIVVKAWNLSANAPATIKVLNKFENVVYEEAIGSEENHIKRYDFSKMKAGKYTLVLESKTGEVRKSFIVGSNGTVREDKSEAYRYFRPRVIEKRADRSVHVAFSNVTEVPLNLVIATTSGKVIYSAKVSGYQDFNKLINLKKLLPDHYVLSVYNADYSYHTEVRNY